MDLDEVENTQSRLSSLLISLLSEDHTKKIDASLDEESEDEYDEYESPAARKSTIPEASPVSVTRKSSRSSTGSSRARSPVNVR
jgi:hypothetical protein